MVPQNDDLHSRSQGNVVADQLGRDAEAVVEVNNRNAVWYFTGEGGWRSMDCGCAVEFSRGR
jgi:hypothetical protein